MAPVELGFPGMLSYLPVITSSEKGEAAFCMTCWERLRDRIDTKKWGLSEIPAFKPMHWKVLTLGKTLQMPEFVQLSQSGQQ